jgi:hypothetical protein
VIDAYWWWWPMMAQVATEDFQISGKWLIALLVAIIPVVGGVWLKGKSSGKSEVENAVTLKKPVPTIVTREEEAWATKPDLEDHIERTEKQIHDIWEAIQAERGIARTALGRIHERLDVQTKVTAMLQGSVEEVGKNVDRLLDLALNRKPPPR